MIFSAVWLYLLAGISFFLRTIYWCIIVDVILGWLTLFGVHIVIGPLNSITRPLYDFVRKTLPTTIGMLDLAPLVLLLIIDVMIGLGIPALAQLLQ